MWSNSGEKDHKHSRLFLS